MKKLVIANRGAGQIGKSTAIKAVFDLLTRKGYNLLEREFQRGDIKAIFEISGIKVGIESQGDPDSNMEKSMEEFVKKNCSIIVTACRTKGSTYSKVAEYLGKDESFDILWYAHYVYQVPGADAIRDKLNEAYAQQVLELIEGRINGTI